MSQESKSQESKAPAGAETAGERQKTAHPGRTAPETSTTNCPLPEAAAAYARLGYVPIPLNKDRRPILRGWPDAEAGEDAARKRFEQCTAHGVALLTSGFIVLDIDRNHADDVDGVDEFNRLRDGRPFLPHQTVRTRRDGFHYYFKAPEGVALRTAPGALGGGIDLKAGRALVTVPPTDGYGWQVPPPWLRYARPTNLPVPVAELPDLPDWLVDLARRPDPPPPPPLLAFQPIQGERYAEKVFHGELSEVAMAAKGQRNAVLFKAAARLGDLVGAGMLGADMAAQELLVAAEACGLVRDDGRRAVEATIASGLRRGMSNASPLLGGRRHAH
jgi:hypothetical protein